jgi:hypothetical protein
MTNPRDTHHGDAVSMKTACGRVLGKPFRGGLIYMNGTHKLIVSFGTAPVTCSKCLKKMQPVAPTC